MNSRKSKARRSTHAAKVALRSAQSSGVIKCYVEQFKHPNGLPDVRIREKVSGRKVQVLSDNLELQNLAPLANLLRDCHAHGGGLREPRNRREYIGISASTVLQNSQEVSVQFDQNFAVQVHILTSAIVCPPVSVWCYIEEYSSGDGSLGLRLRQKMTGRKVEMYGRAKDHLTAFLASPMMTGEDKHLPNLYEQDGYEDYVLVSGGTSVDSYDVIRFEDGDELAYLLGPTPDTAYRDAFRVLEEESAAVAHSRTAQAHFEKGRYREAVLSARLSVEMACGGRGSDVKERLVDAPRDVITAAEALYATRHVAVHEGGTRIEQQDAQQAITAMKRVIDHLAIPGTKA